MNDLSEETLEQACIYIEKYQNENGLTIKPKMIQLDPYAVSLMTKEELDLIKVKGIYGIPDKRRVELINKMMKYRMQKMMKNT